MKSHSQFPTNGHLLSEASLEKELKSFPVLQTFWSQPAAYYIIRTHPTPTDPVYEIQLILDLDTRVETYGWIWIDALEGQILKMFPDS